MMRKRRVAIIWLGMVLMFFIGSHGNVGAASWDFEPKVLVYSGYDDNILFNQRDPVQDYYAGARPELLATLNSERLELDIATYLDAIRFYEEEDLDTENYWAEVDGLYRLNDRYLFSLTISGRKDTTIDSQLEETGRIVDREDRERYRCNGILEYQLTERSDVKIDYRYTSTNYESEDEVNREEHSLLLPYTKWFNDELDRIVVQPRYTRATLENDTVVDAYKLSAGWIHIFSETLRIENFIGFGITEEKSDTDETQYRSGSADLRLIKEGEIVSLRGGFRSDVNLSPTGELDEVDRFYLQADRMLTERLGIRLISGIYFTRPVEIYDQYERVYYEIKPAITYRISKDHSLGLGYSYQSEYDRTLSEDRGRIRNLIWISIN